MKPSLSDLRQTYDKTKRYAHYGRIFSDRFLLPFLHFLFFPSTRIDLAISEALLKIMVYLINERRNIRKVVMPMA